MAQSQIAFRESFHYWNGNAIAGQTFYLTLIRGSVFPVGAGTITSASTLGGLTECSGTGYARQAFTMGADTNGVMVIPAVSFSNGANAWSADCAAVALCSALTVGVALYCWDLTAVRDMSITASIITITSPPLNIFTENPGGV